MLAENAKLLIQQTATANAQTDQMVAELIAFVSKESDEVMLAVLSEWWKKLEALRTIDATLGGLATLGILRIFAELRDRLEKVQ